MDRPSLSGLVGLLSKRASIGERFALIGLVALAPLLFVSATLLREIGGDLDRLARERAGAEYARSVWRILDGAAAGSVDEARVAAFVATRARFDERLDTSEASTVLLDLVRTGAPAEALAEAGVRLMNRIGARSGLLLDDDPSTYHHAQAIVTGLPEVALAIADANVLLGTGPHPPAASPGLAFGRVKFALDRLELSLGEAADASDSHVARAQVETAMSRLRTEMAAHERVARDWFKERQQAYLAGSGDAPPSTPLLRHQHDLALAAADSAFAALIQHLTSEIIARESDRRDTALGALAVLIASIVLMVGLVSLVTASILQPWRKLRETTDRMAAGKLDAPAACMDYDNEVGEVARALEMFRLAMVERASLADDLARERDTLEDRIDLRTRELVAERAKAEENERLLWQAMHTVRAGVWSFDRARDVIWISCEAADILGKTVTQADFTDGILNLVTSDEREVLMGMAPDPETGLRGLYRDTRFVRPDGAERWLHSTAVPMGDGRIVGLIMDVTDRKRQEIELAEARQRAEEATTAKSRFIASMSHEVRTPLNGVLAMAAALERTALHADQRRMVDVMHASGRQLLAMVDDVLDIAKIEAGSMALHEEPFDLAANVQAVAALFREAARSKGLLLRVDTPPEVQGQFVGDALRIRQVLQNFVSNAVKFTDHGAILVRASLAPGGGIRLSVDDSGVGVALEKSHLLFDRFVQADGFIARRYGGSGLGLAIARELAELMGGRVGVDSTPGIGSTFWFEAPLPRALDTTGAAAAPVARQLRILAAEDNPGNRLVLATLLAQAGLSADFAHDGESVVAAAAERAYDIILMDVQMPRMDGIEAARTIRALRGPNAGAPILALTANTQPDTLAACRDAGMCGHVRKPILPAALYAAMDEALNGLDYAEPLARSASAG